jgi:3-oxoacyl-[acyl-carrier protein] reductase
MSSESQETVFISGGTSGLGLGIAEHFVKKGKSVVLCARNEDAVSVTVEHLKNLATSNQYVIGLTLDVSSRDSTTQMIEELQRLDIRVDVLICNAGVIGPIDRLLEIELADWQDAFNINLYGTLNLILEFLPSMIHRKQGRVIHISGGGATSPISGMTSYAASKVAAVRLIETLALEYGDSGVTFNSVAPGMLQTKLLDQMLNAGPERIGEKLYLKSLSKAESQTDSTSQAIDLIDFLASEVSVGINGKLISAEWDNWSEWTNRLNEIKSSDLYTLRRITGRDRGQEWADL